MSISRFTLSFGIAFLACTVACADGFSVQVCVTGKLSEEEQRFLEEARSPLTEEPEKEGCVAITLQESDSIETDAAQRAVEALSRGAKGIVFRCLKTQLVRYDFDMRCYPGALAGTLAVLAELFSDIEVGSAANTTVDGVKLLKVHKTDGSPAYIAHHKERRGVKLKLGEGTWCIASLIADGRGKMRRVFRKTDTVCGTLTPTPVLISRVCTEPRKEDETATFWDAQSVHVIHLTFSAKDWQTLKERELRGQFAKEYVKADFEWNGKSLRDVGVRLKGNSSLMAGSRDGRFPLKIDFDRFEDQLFLGMKKLNLSNNFKDPSAMREYLAYELFRKSGLCAGRSAFVRLQVTVEGAFKKRSFGLYTAVEQVDGAFLHRWFGNAEGTLFKPEVFGDDPLRYRSDRPEDYARCELKYGEIHPDYDKLIRFAKLAHIAPPEEFAREITDVLNVDTFLKFLAVNALLANYDSYIGTGHNFYLYYDAPDGKWVFIPWDLNEAFGMFTPHGYNPRTCASVSVLKPVAMGRRALVEQILGVERWRKAYEGYVGKLLLGVFKDNPLVARVDEIRQIIEPVIKEEGDRRRMEFRAGIIRLKELIRDRYAAVFSEFLTR